MNEVTRCITTKGKAAKNEQENDDSDILRALYKKMRTILFTYLRVLLTCSNKDNSVIFEVIFEQILKLSIKTMVLTSLIL